MSDALFAYPKQAAFGRVLPKNKIYEHSSATTRLKDLFVRQVEQIVWQYKLAPETVNLPAKFGVSEIQIFSVTLKTSELSLDVLRCIDSAVQFPIIFELQYEGKTQVIASYKRPSDLDSTRWELSDYFSTEWLPSDQSRSEMPRVLDLGKLYEQLMSRLIPLSTRQKESLADLVSRVEQVEAKRREIEKTANKLAKEKQFNRKVVINTNLRQLKMELEQLSR